MMNIRDAIQQLAVTNDEIYCQICTVDAIDEQARTVDCTPIDEEKAPILGVNLQANQDGEVGIVQIPTLGSYVVVAFINNAAGVVVLAEEIDKVYIEIGETTIEVVDKQITINGGDLGGLINIEPLTEKINGLKSTVNDLVKAYNSHDHITTATIGTGGPGQVAPTTKTAQPAVEFKREDYEDKKVTH